MEPFEIGLTLTGSVSAGAYTAGVIDFLLQALDEWDKAKQSDRQNYQERPHNHENQQYSFHRTIGDADPHKRHVACLNRDQYRDPNGTPNLEALQKNIEEQKQVGFLSAAVPGAKRKFSPQCLG